MLKKKTSFLRSTNFKLLSRKRKFINCDYPSSSWFVTGGHCDYLPQAPKNLATPLSMVNEWLLVMGHFWNDTGGGEQNFSQAICLSVILSKVSLRPPWNQTRALAL
jgi:hypothetical protein